MGAVLLSNSKDPIEYFFCREPIDCRNKRVKKESDIKKNQSHKQHK